MISAAVALLLATATGDPTEWVAAQGGGVERNAQGQVVGVVLRSAWVTDIDLARFVCCKTSRTFSAGKNLAMTPRLM